MYVYILYIYIYIYILYVYILPYHYFSIVLGSAIPEKIQTRGVAG